MSESVLDIESIAAGGDGVARADGLVVFVPRAAPGDRGLVTWAKRGAFARGRLTRIDVASRARVTPRCQHYDGDNCGGCQLQHIAYEEQLRAKQQIVVDAIERIGGRRGFSVVMHASASEWRYRRKLTLAFRRQDVGDGWTAGLHRYDDPLKIFQLRDCEITEQAVLAVFRQVLQHGDLLPRARSLRMSVLALEEGAHLSVGGGREWSSAQQLGAQCDLISGIWWIREKADGGEAAAAHSAEVPRRLMFRRGADVPGASFAQVNVAVARQLTRHVQTIVRQLAPRNVVDAYCGTGDAALALAADGVHVVAIEADADAVQAFSAKLPGHARAVTALVEDCIAAELPAELVLLNPPRDGVNVRVTQALSRDGAVSKAIVYTSCNAATLARDIARLPGFSIRSIDCFDMFPQTAHIETVCVLVPASAA